MRTFDIDIIGTHLSLRVDTSSSATVDEDFSHIERRLKDFELRFSRFLPGNWLHTLNLSRSGILDTDALRMLECALQVARDTDGYFDPTIGTRLRDLGYGSHETAIWKSENVFDDIFSDRESGTKGDYRDILIQGNTVTLENDIELEFGGVGKGYLIDVIKEILESYPRFLINFGGDLYGRGGWKVGLESPFASDEIIGVRLLEDDFLACSAPTKRKWGSHHHLINPKTGESSTEIVATYIEGTSGMMTDAYATALSVVPWEKAGDILENTPGIEGILVRYDGTLYRSRESQSEIFS